MTILRRELNFSPAGWIPFFCRLCLSVVLLAVVLSLWANCRAMCLREGGGERRARAQRQQVQCSAVQFSAFPRPRALTRTCEAGNAAKLCDLLLLAAAARRRWKGRGK